MTIQTVLTISTIVLCLHKGKEIQAQTLPGDVGAPSESDRSHAQHSASSPVIFPLKKNNGYFSYRILPNGGIDPVDYETAKAKFVAENPKGYQAMLTEQSGSRPLQISQSDYNSFPPNKRKEVDTHPDHYVVVKNK
ncbi:MAG: hypothetical protein K9J06_06185 [Flavobacteriales bacterium]|nr:hypothetical protein [Flavobacteriales bacterium]